MKVTKGPARADYQVVFSVSERPVQSLQLPTCIMPNGSLVTGFSKKVLPNGQTIPEIVFWERNGLRHGEFVLPHQESDGKSIDVVDLKYNSDSSVLAILIETNGARKILLYTRSNWKWYWKQVVDLKNIVSFHWSKKY